MNIHTLISQYNNDDISSIDFLKNVASIISGQEPDVDVVENSGKIFFISNGRVYNISLDVEVTELQ